MTAKAEELGEASWPPRRQAPVPALGGWAPVWPRQMFDDSLSVCLYNDDRVEREGELDWNGLFPLCTELSININTCEHNHGKDL